MKKIFLILLAMLFTGIVFAQPRMPRHSVQIVDERGETVTTITSVSIYAPDSTTDAVIYSDRGLNNVMVIPVTEASTNTTLVDGVLSWYGPDKYNFSITDGTNIATNANHRARSSSEGTLVFPSYITAISSTTYADTTSATWGSSPAFVQSIAAGVMTFTPAADNANFVIGVSGTSLNSDFNVYVGTLLGLKVDAGTPSLIWDGGAATLNHNSNKNVGLCSGTSTGAVTIGSSTAGTIALETTAGITVHADDSIAVTTSAGTIDIDSTGGDLGIDAIDKSILIDAGESATDAIIIQATGAAGGVELICGTGDITLDSGDDIFLEANTGIGDVISIINTAGTDAAAIVITTTAAGSIDINSGDNVTIDTADDFTVDTADGGISLIADGSANGDVTLDAEDDIIVNAGDDVDINVVDNMTIDTTDGSLVVTTAGAANGDVTFTVADKFSVTSTDTAAAGATIIVNGGASETIHLNSKQGTSAAAINIDADVGGITLLADGGSAGDITLDAEDDIILTTTGKLTITNTEPVTISGTLTPVAVNIVDQVITDTASVTLTAATSGKIHTIADLTQATTIDLPAEADGMNFEFWYVGGVAEADDHIIDSESNTNFYIGGLQWFDSDDNTMTEVYSDGDSNSILTLHNLEAGTVIKITCDGVHWYITGTVYSDTTPSFGD